MAEITASMIKELREKTLAGMLECKKALAESDGDMEKAAEYLRKKGLAAANKRADRAVKEGVIVTKSDARSAMMAEVNCETDFVARNEDFKKLANTILEKIAADKNCTSNETLPAEVVALVQNQIATTGENTSVGRIFKYEIDPSKKGTIAIYMHSNNKLAVMLELNTDSDAVASNGDFAKLAYDLAMQAAAANPMCVNPSDISAEVVAKEREIYMAQMKDSGKPANVLEKIIDGKVQKFFTDVCLVKQAYIKDPNKTVEALVAETEKALGGKITVARFARIQIGA